jgi:hypothetical protein
MSTLTSGRPSLPEYADAVTQAELVIAGNGIAEADRRPVNYAIVSRRNGWITAVGADGRVARISTGGNGR